MRYLALLVLAIVPVLACEEDEKATPQVIFFGELQSGSSASCRDFGELFTVGDFGNPNADPPVASTPVKAGGAFEQGNADLLCSVTSAGTDEFNVDATVRLTGATGGLFKIDGKFKPSGTQENIHVVVSNVLKGNQYEARDCTVEYDASYRGVASGRVWGIVTCEAAANPSAQTACKVRAEFRFENCSQ